MWLTTLYNRPALPGAELGDTQTLGVLGVDYVWFDPVTLDPPDLRAVFLFLFDTHTFTSARRTFVYLHVVKLRR